nr:Chain C, VASOACTIVE INTESTINAL POLYPEPTIDE RECEPTOR [Homo sapiens]1OGT_C Chain C, VASOACTIVE INTESTINAL POLYPEPTIDE RECEPTOR 1 [Homo sapiens]5DEF_C Chain C, peptide derived from VASOACTIVE INTESTINAL POLYPEPTIDE RECEPTOR 1 (pVIPR) [Homo sapiens]5DEG_C Chain C, Peptide derived of VASOACTIVE INTESTINAL POLYPEPTIDE RECEPTOR 1 (pVIPR) [Homo sapiens]5IB1_C Chain C, Vasoactive intestinal polypeptide receptor 1 [Homo sapiens]5IB2_C Chain C, Vasoactive intestinal polypeptide receptor 1 [Homo sapien
RRKWRRWHL